MVNQKYAMHINGLWGQPILTLPPHGWMAYCPGCEEYGQKNEWEKLIYSGTSLEFIAMS